MGWVLWTCVLYFVLQIALSSGFTNNWQFFKFQFTSNELFENLLLVKNNKSRFFLCQCVNTTYLTTFRHSEYSFTPKNSAKTISITLFIFAIIIDHVRSAIQLRYLFCRFAPSQPKKNLGSPGHNTHTSLNSQYSLVCQLSEAGQVLMERDARRSGHYSFGILETIEIT